ncbi:MAG TPA: DUF2252 family protein [Polyangiaceae bacterium]|jgi:uncharacterized protein (DUF2252 family)|nr:DUF2252 family protein [Polyangiaceae bacterium]
MLSPNPLETARRQLDRDRQATSAFPDLFRHKLTRMAGSPLAYLRGTAPLFYQLLADHPELASGPDGEGWLVGDAHLENFGAYRSTDADESVVFDVNDFDEAIVGPLRWDVVRLLTSVILGGRELGSNGQQSVQLCSSILDGYVEALTNNQIPKNPPAPVRRLLEKVEQRTHKDLLDRRTERSGDGRRFIRGERYPDLAQDLVPKARAAFAAYVERLDPNGKLSRDHFAIEDVAFRVAGCGSLGALRVAVLTLGKGELDNRWIFDMKAEGVPSAQPLLAAPAEAPAERVRTATLICLKHPPRMLGTSELDGQSLFVRRLSPQEDKLDLTHLRAEELPELAHYLGALLGRVHARGAKTPPAQSWSRAELSGLIERAIAIAGIHEAAYLALCFSGAQLPPR